MGGQAVIETRVESKKNETIRRIRSLQEKKYRRALDAFFIEGKQSCDDKFISHFFCFFQQNLPVAIINFVQQKEVP